MNRFRSSSPKNETENYKYTRPGGLNPERYIRADDGSIDYILDITLFDFPSDKIKVHTNQNYLYVTIDQGNFENGIYESDAQLFRRVKIPSNVDVRTISCSLNPNGILTVCGKTLSIKYPSPTQDSFKSDYIRSPIYSSKQPTAIGQISRPREPRHVTFSSPSEAQPSPGLPPISKRSESHIKPLRSQQPRHAPPRQINPKANQVIPLKIFHKGLKQQYSGSHSTHDIFTMQIELRPELTENDIWITCDGVVLHIAAEMNLPCKDSRGNYMEERQMFQHRSEHTLPNNLDTGSLTAKLFNGVVHLKGFYIRPSGSYGSVERFAFPKR